MKLHFSFDHWNIISCVLSYWTRMWKDRSDWLQNNCYTLEGSPKLIRVVCHWLFIDAWQQDFFPKYKHRNTNTQIQTHKSKYTNTNTQIQIHKYKYTNTNTQIQIHKYKYTTTNTQIQIHKYKYTNTKSNTPQKSVSCQVPIRARPTTSFLTPLLQRDLDFFFWCHIYI